MSAGDAWADAPAVRAARAALNTAIYEFANGRRRWVTMDRRQDAYAQAVAAAAVAGERALAETLTQRLLAIGSDTGFEAAADGTLLLWCSDTFAYACADCEPVPDAHIGAVRNLIRDFDYAGAVAWVAMRRGREPMAAWLNVPENASPYNRARYALGAALAEGELRG